MIVIPIYLFPDVPDLFISNDCCVVLVLPVLTDLFADNDLRAFVYLIQGLRLSWNSPCLHRCQDRTGPSDRDQSHPQPRRQVSNLCSSSACCVTHTVIAGSGGPRLEAKFTSTIRGPRLIALVVSTLPDLVRSVCGVFLPLPSEPDCKQSPPSLSP